MRLRRAAKRLLTWSMAGPLRWAMDRILSLTPSSDRRWRRYGSLLLRAEQFEMAHRSLKKVKSDESPEFLLLCAMALAGSQRTDAAIALVDQAERLDPAVSSAWLRLAQIAERSGEQDVAIAAWSHLFKATCSEQAVLRAGRLLVKQGRASEACDLYRDAASLGLTSEQLRRAYADAAGRNHDWELSSELWRSVVDDCPGDDIVHAKLVRAIDEAEAARPNIDRMKENTLLRFQSRAGWEEKAKQAINSAALRSERVHRRVSHTPWRLLIVSHHNWNFMVPIIEELNGRQELEIRTLDTSAIHRRPGATDTDLLPRYAAELLEWADVVFVEWVNEAAGWLMDRIDDHTKIVMRLHSYELMRQWPLLIDWGRVDGCIFVAEHNRQRMLGAWDIEAIGCATHVIPNLFDLSTFDRPKSPAASWTLGMAGYNTVNKNPMMALDIFDALLDLDTRWRLRLVGHPWSPVEPDAPTHVPAVAYGLEFEQRLAQHRARETVMVDPWTADLPAWFQDVGIILSCSDREGSHESVREGIASGAASVVRNWPWASRFGGIEPTFPDSFRFDEPSKAAEYIATLGSSEGVLKRGHVERAALRNRESPDRIVERLLEVVRP